MGLNVGSVAIFFFHFSTRTRLRSFHGVVMSYCRGNYARKEIKHPWWLLA
jgi:hypothetical protein